MTDRLLTLSMPQEIDAIVAELTRRGGETAAGEVLEFFGRPGKDLVRAATELGFVEEAEGRLRLTARGKQYAMAAGDDKPFQLLQGLSVFAPYRHLLREAAQAPGDVLDEAWMLAQMTQLGKLPVAERDQKRASATFLGLLAKADLGKLSDRGKKLHLFRTSRAVIATAISPPKKMKRVPKPPARSVAVTPAAAPAERPPKKSERLIIEGAKPAISVSVDMTDWAPDQITAFFKGAYGVFD